MTREKCRVFFVYGCGARTLSRFSKFLGYRIKLQKNLLHLACTPHSFMNYASKGRFFDRSRSIKLKHSLAEVITIGK